MSHDHYTAKDAPEGHELHHPHELSLCSMVEDGKERIECGLCKDGVNRKRSGDLVYVCKSSSCGYVLHKSCGDLPLQINHSFHHSHGPLNLAAHSSGSGRSCFSCRRLCYLYYECSECRFRMDPECALMIPMRRGEEESIQHITHPHPLLLVDVRACFACDKISRDHDEAYYGCTRCRYFLHKSCAEVPLEFSPHPLHPHHSVLSLFVDSKNSPCSICGIWKNQTNYLFKCDDRECSFQICLKCIFSDKKKNIKYEDHDHLLCYVDKGEKIDHCNAYDAYCTRPDLVDIVRSSKELTRTASSIFKCPDCDFRLHFLCGPLPATIKHDCHIHSLTLLDSLIEDDFGEYYCDVCETQRDPRIRLYHCNDCKFFAHVHCVISEIVKVITGDVEGVELKALGNDYWRRRPTELETTSFTLMDLIHQINEYDKGRLKEFYKWDDASSKVNVDIVQPKQRKTILNDDDEVDKVLRLSRFDATNFKTLIHEFDEFIVKERLELRSRDLRLKMVVVKGYLIPYPLAGVLQTLVDEYGDIGNRFGWSLEMKNFVCFILCQVVKRMRETLVKDITGPILRAWYLHLRFVSLYGFEISFAALQLEMLMDAYSGLQAETLQEKIPNLLKSKLAEIQRGLEKCNEYKGSSEKSEYMKYCIEKASKSRWLYSFHSLYVKDAESSAIPRGHMWWLRM